MSEAPTGPEFREIRGARPVDEPRGGIEFREVRGARPVSEAYTGEEYRPAGFSAPEDEHPATGGDLAGSSAEVEPEGPPVVQPLVAAPRRRTRRRRIELDFKPKTVRRAIIYQEILGPPMADRRR